MRSLALSALLTLAPAAAGAQLAPRSIALELGFTRESAPALGDRAPLALAASWWIAEDADLTARVAFGFAARTAGRAAGALYEAGFGLRRTFGGGAVRPFAAVDAAFLQASAGPTLAWEQGLRLAASAGLEVFPARDLSVAVAAAGGEALLASGSGPSVGVTVRLAGYF